MTIKEIYKKYKVLPLLQQHLVRVAFVGKTIAVKIPEITNTDNIVKACLLHDIGNIIKFNLTTIPEAVEPEGLQYWEQVKQEFVSKYGDDEVEATHAIIKELGISEEIKTLIFSFGTRNVKEVTESGEIERMIVNYSDHRVAPFAIESLKERIEDQHKRILKSLPREEGRRKIESRKQDDDAKYLLEEMIFKKYRIKPSEVGNPDIEKITKEFLSYKIT